ncbi:MAG TPA: hypothetical protein VFH78_02335, partial [Candidatus Thermoplasmatota archaeon]|nr:hypothetical protein [Candidatus Thermoplasmatota archaeon]
EEPVARGATSDDGTFAALLPAGRYAVYAQHEAEGKAVTVTLEHGGRALLVLESLTRRATLTVEARGLDGMPLSRARVEVRALPSGAVATSLDTDDDGVAQATLPHGPYEVRVGEAVTRTYLEADTLVRVVAEEPPPAEALPPMSRYAQNARAATAVVAPLEHARVRDEVWN